MRPSRGRTVLQPEPAQQSPVCLSRRGSPTTERGFEPTLKQRSQDYVLKSLGGHEFVLNVCRSVSHETWALKAPNPSDVGGFIRLDRGDFSVGYALYVDRDQRLSILTVCSVGVSRPRI